MDQLTLEEYLSVPYILSLDAVQGADGEWMRRAAYPEFPGCSAVGSSPLEAIEELERTHRRLVRERLARGEEIPLPRPPLPSWRGPADLPDSERPAGGTP